MARDRPNTKAASNELANHGATDRSKAHDSVKVRFSHA